MICKAKALLNATLKFHGNICPYYGIPSFTFILKIYFSIF